MAISRPANLKVLLLGAVPIAVAAVFGLLFKTFVAAPSLIGLVFVLITGIFLLALFLIHTLLNDRFWVGAGFIVLIVAAMTVFFIGKGVLLVLVGGIIAAAAFIEAYHNGQSEIKNSIEIRFWHIARKALSMATVAIAVFLSLAYFASFDLKNQKAGEQALEVVIRPLEPIVAGYLPGFSSRSTLTQIARRSLPPELQMAGPEIQNQAIGQVAGNLAELLGKTFGISVRAGDSVVDIIYKATFGRLLKLSSSLQTLILMGAAIALIFFVKFALFFVDWLAILLGYALYQLLWGFGFFKIELRNKVKKVILLE